MPSGLIDEEDGVGPWCDCLGDFGQMQVHRFGVAGREDQSRALSLLRADGSEDVGRGGALIPRSAWASTALGPPAGDLVLLTNARFIREPNLYFPNIDCLFRARLHPGALGTFFKILDGSFGLRMMTGAG